MGDSASDLKLISRRIADAGAAIAHGCSEQRFYRAVAAAARTIDPTHPGAGRTLLALTELLDLYAPRVPSPPPVKRASFASDDQSRPAPQRWRGPSISGTLQ